MADASDVSHPPTHGVKTESLYKYSCRAKLRLPLMELRLMQHVVPQSLKEKQRNLQKLMQKDVKLPDQKWEQATSLYYKLKPKGKKA